MGRVGSTRVRRITLLTSLTLLLMVVIVAFLATPVHATTLEKLSLDQLAQRASVIVVARTTQTSVESLTADGLTGSYLQTRVGAQVLEVLKGSPAATLSITVPGGQTRGISALVDGMPAFTPGETSLLFLDKKHRVIGGFQGKLSIIEGMVERLGQPLGQVKGRIAKAVGQRATAMKGTTASSFPSIHEKRTLPQPLPNQAAQALPEGFLPLSFVDGFESGTGAWTKEGSPTWAQDSYRHSVGSYSAYCIGSSYNGPAHYPANVDAVMYKGPFDLSGTTAGTFEFDLWLDSELGYDGILFGVSLDGQTYYPDGRTGNSGGWDHIVMDLTAIETDTGTLDVTGRSQVWLVFEFLSDESDEGGPYEGAYVDQVKLTSTAPVIPTIRSISPTSASAGTGSRVTITGSTFGTTPGATGSVNFFFDFGETIPGNIISWSSTSIVAEVPVGEVDGYPGSAGSGPVTVTDSSGAKSAGKDFQVTFGYGQAKWSTPYAGFRINPNTPDTTSEKNLVDAAAATWSDSSAFVLNDTGLCSTTDYLNDGENDLFWSSTLLPDGVIAATVPVVSGSTITEVDMIFNDYYPWGDGLGRKHGCADGRPA